MRRRPENNLLANLGGEQAESTASNGDRPLRHDPDAASRPRCMRSRGRPRPGAWRDSTPYDVQFVTAEGGVRLEVLDWGGPAAPLSCPRAPATARTSTMTWPRSHGLLRRLRTTRRGDAPRASRRRRFRLAACPRRARSLDC